MLEFVPLTSIFGITKLDRKDVGSNTLYDHQVSLLLLFGERDPFFANELFSWLNYQALTRDKSVGRAPNPLECELLRDSKEQFFAGFTVVSCCLKGWACSTIERSWM